MPRNNRKRKSEDTYCLYAGDDFLEEGSESIIKRRKAEYESYSAEPIRIVKKRSREDDDEERLRSQTKHMKIIEEQDKETAEALIVDRRRMHRRTGRPSGCLKHRAAAYDTLLHRNTCGADLQNRYRWIVSQL